MPLDHFDHTHDRIRVIEKHGSAETKPTAAA